MYKQIITMLLLVLFLSVLDGARILCVFPVPSYSHHAVFEAYTNALASRGHTIVRITPFPTKKNDSSNVTDVDVSLSKDYFKSLVDRSRLFKKRGVISETSSVTARNYISLVHMLIDQFSMESVRQLIESNNVFDLLVTEAFLDYPLVFSHLFGDVPVIQISSGHALAENFETMGAVSRHPIYYPNLWRNKFQNLNVWEIITEIYTELVLYLEFARLADEQTKMLRHQFGPNTPSVEELRQRVQLLFVNTHPLFDNNRPVPPSVQYLGSLHLDRNNDINEQQTMDYNLMQFLNNSTNGVVYVSFGTSIRVSDMDDEFLFEFITAFKQLPYNILWKTDGLPMEHVLPKNVLTQTWLPQHHVLKHSNVVAFVTQGGMQSTDEAIDACVPLIGIPFMGDQAYNTNKYEELGIGRNLDPVTLTSHILVSAVLDVTVNNKSRYTDNIKALNRSTNYRTRKPMEKAIWYTEHVIDNGKNPILKTKAANVSYSKYYMSDIIVPVITFLVMTHLGQAIRRLVVI
ncbi:egt [Helicoverpa armigera nucleopolyhedrovirus]|uniref:Ecdysteroid UDP-glucosyltransferase n=1 Tax=Helicoverpa armigera nucleopolyhedrovirus TaxID=51313 RepID=Q99GT6_9ABAC|nr:egt [Helicoverpa armigera nucleopolyhedrovirus G4]AAG53869.1 egt [Helicoverpa armigera nucleopolyhedrovirus G4]UCC42597.1 egt [Helicoverpa armigera nucleopolyhedrovirus]